MKKSIIITILVGLLIVIGIFISANNLLFTGRIIGGQDFHLSTIAICNKTNYCEDYEIECDGKELIKATAKGDPLQKENDWKDPRGEQKENLCE